MNAANERFPTLLVVAEFSPNAAKDGPLVRQMLKGYPPDKITCWNCLAHPDRNSGQAVGEEFFFKLPRRLYPTRRRNAMKAWLLEKIWTPLAARHLAEVVARVEPQQVWVVLHGWAIPVVDRLGLIRKQRSHVSV